MESDKFSRPEIRQTLDLARTEIKLGKPDQALQLIESIRNDVEQAETGLLVAEYRLLLAEAFGLKGDQAAESLFSEALDLIAKLEQPNAELEMRANEHFADYLIKFAARPLDARKHILAANRVAIREGLENESIRLGMKTVLTY
jgi:hypothetical protein